MTAVADAERRGRMRDARALLALGTGLLLLLGIVGGSIWLSARNGEALDAVRRLLRVQASVTALDVALQNAESGQRGFLLAGRDSYLVYYEAALVRVPGLFAELSALLPGTTMEATVAPLRRAAEGKLAELRRTIELYRAGDLAAALAVVRTDQGKTLMDEIRGSTTALAAELEAELHGQLRAIARRGTALVVLDSGGVLLVVVLGVLVATGTRRSLKVLATARAALTSANAGLELSNASLESTVARRTADLTEANDQIQRFAYIVSHDLRAPLVNIMGFTSELEQAVGVLRRHMEAGGAVPDDVALAANDEMPEALRFIRTSTAKMDRLIGAILKLSREGRRNLVAEPLAMPALLGSIRDSLAHQVGSAGAAIELGPLPDVVADRVAVEQVFANVLENALKYGLPGRPVRIEVAGRLEGGMAWYSVADNGRGIAERDRERVFELFRRAGDQRVPGEGIGLAHVRALVRRLGGSIRFESVLGQGTTFHIRLPTVPLPTADEAA